MVRLISGVVVAVIMWFVVVTILNLGLRHGWPDYASVEKAMTFTLAMMIARLLESAVASLAIGYVAARLGRNRWAALISGVILLALFVPLHVRIWTNFPVWYHLTFLVSLPLLVWAGGKLDRGVAATA